MFEVILSPEGQAFFAAANPPLAGKLARSFAHLERDPRRHNNIKRLSGKLAGRLRYRVGDWRVIYRIDERARQVHVLVIAHRSEVYE
jgi:mRNA interferase RelE/StbE